MAVIDRKKLPEKVIDEIRNRIETGQWKLGEKLPNQNELSLELGVSRTSLREAMKILDLLGVIEQRPGYGTVIRNNIPELNKESDNLSLLSNEEATFELLEAREIVECGAVKLVAIKATEKQVAALFEIVGDMDRCLKNKDYEEYKKLDNKFHEQIAVASANRFLNDPSIALHQYMEKFIDENVELLPGLVKQSQRHHRAICEAVAKHDPDLAVKEMRSHIREIANSYRRFQDSAAGKKKDR